MTLKELKKSIGKAKAVYVYVKFSANEGNYFRAVKSDLLEIFSAHNPNSLVDYDASLSSDGTELFIG